MGAALRELRRVLAALGASELRTQENPAAVGEVTAAISPWRLPAEVEQFWRLTDGFSSSLSLFPHPHATDPHFALECWHAHQQQPGMTPDLLFPVCYESHAFLLVELDGSPGPGGACFTWAYGLEPFVLVASDLTSYLEVAAQTLEVCRVERHERDGQTFLRFDDTAFQAALRDRFCASLTRGTATGWRWTGTLPHGRSAGSPRPVRRRQSSMPAARPQRSRHWRGTPRRECPGEYTRRCWSSGR